MAAYLDPALRDDPNHAHMFDETTDWVDGVLVRFKSLYSELQMQVDALIQAAKKDAPTDHARALLVGMQAQFDTACRMMEAHMQAHVGLANATHRDHLQVQHRRVQEALARPEPDAF